MTDSLTQPAISFRGVGKRYDRIEQQPMLLKTLITLRREKRQPLWALRNVDLEIGQGEVIGILGRNGAGKSTMLRLMAGVTQPTEGEIVVRGRVAPLISVGVGFYAEMSGRENIYVNGLLLGLTLEEIEERFDDIVAFSELRDFIDTPVKFYSSGMYMRLGFAVAVHTDPTVLLVDEVLSVGDVSFQLKCFEKMKEIRAGGATLVVVSHNVQAIRVLAPRVAVAAHGEVAFDGDPDQAIALYYRLLEDEARAQEAPARPGDGTMLGGVRVLDRSLEGPDGKVSTVVPGTPLKMRLRLAFDRDVPDPGFYFTIHNETGTLVYAAQTPVDVRHRTFAAGEESEIELGFVANLEGGTYRLGYAVTAVGGGHLHCAETMGAQFFVDPGVWSYGVAKLDGTFSVDGTLLAEERSHRLDGAPEPAPFRGAS